MFSSVGNQLGGGHQERLQERGTFEAWVLCPVLCTGMCVGGRCCCLEGRQDCRRREESMQRPRGIKVHDASRGMPAKPHRVCEERSQGVLNTLMMRIPL